MRKSFIMLSMMVCALNASAQTYLEHLQTKEAGKGNVTVVQSPEIDKLVNGNDPKDAVTNKPATQQPEKKTSTDTKNESAPKKSTHEETSGSELTTTTTTTKSNAVRRTQKVMGYRIQVFAGGNSRTDKNKAESTGNKIKMEFPDQPVYVHFYSPRWICRMGNYRTYAEAESMLRKVREAGFRQASLVKGKITVAY